MKAHDAGQRGGFVLGLIVGLLVGLMLALGVALYITKAPIPFINKVPQRTADQDSAEAERNRNWDPNGPLGAKPGPRVAAGAAAAASTAAPSAALPAVPPTTAPAPGVKPSTRDPAAILSGAATPAPTPAPAPAAKPAADSAYIFFVQAGAFTRAEDAEQQRVNLALMGLAAKVSEREQAGRTVYRVRLGPYQQRDQADAQQVKLQDARIEAQIVRVERP